LVALPHQFANDFVLHPRALVDGDVRDGQVALNACKKTRVG
jgi:hypothetical protein